ncbi:MAG: TatD family hydrolase [Oscillospiraceae bacterium]|jgi:TatD DNase family protein|nr:TatD family hydrolase [Oscillospiraceae bacterium]
MLFDTHAHYDDDRFDGDLDSIMGAMPGAGVSYILNASSSVRAAKKGLAIAEKYPFVYASVGVHPHDAKDMDGGSIGEMEALLRHPKAVAVGEIGLDYHYDFSPRGVQRERFVEQLEMAARVGKPVIIHEREARGDTLEIIGKYPGLTGVVHCFSGDWETAQIILGMGWYLSFTGVITFKNARSALEAAARAPIERIMLETDSPYLSPEPVRGGRNSSLNLIHIARKLADARGMSVEALAAATTENAGRFFGIRECSPTAEKRGDHVL